MLDDSGYSLRKTIFQNRKTCFNAVWFGDQIVDRSTNMVEVKMQRIDNEMETKSPIAFRLLIKRILVGSLVILFIGVCSFAILFLAMCLL